MSKPVFYQLVLKQVPDVMTFVYGENAKLMTLDERMGKDATCPECGTNVWYLLPHTGSAVRTGGKAYCECENCGYQTHL